MFSRFIACMFACVLMMAPKSHAQPAPSVAVSMKTFGNARFSCLADGMIRMEYDENHRFEDRPTLAFLYRDRRSAFSSVSVDGKSLRLKTPRIDLTFTDDGKPFNADNLHVSFAMDGGRGEWTPGMDAGGNLRGTTRTLDGISGATSLSEGLLSRDGWAVVDQSNAVALEPRDGQLWVTARNNNGALDWVLFAYGHDYKTALADFANVTGKVPMPPRYAFGSWWSRYWAYSADELRTLVSDFDSHDVPLDVLVIDMDWHLKGWTGYTWNPEYFPEPDEFLKEMHERGLKVTLNLHPADGVGKHEKQFGAMCKALGLDPEKTDRIPFDCTDPNFVDAYFKILHHPMEKKGIDFWWMDWQQGTSTKVPGLDPLPWINYLHWNDMAGRTRETGRRPLIFSRWGGLGNHRYQIGFSGDTHNNWPSLAFQPYFTATAGNVAFGYWSHDIGGHMPGKVPPELYARWIQFGAFSPILRTHTTKNPEAERRIWKFPPEVFNAARKAFQLRYHLLPYIYTTSRECYDTCLPMCRPLYYEWPNEPQAYDSKGSYLFGDALYVAPVTKPADPKSGLAVVNLWLPPGRWRNGFTGQVFEGPTTTMLTVPLDEIPVFVREGYGIPAMPQTLRAGEKPIQRLIAHVFHQPKDQTSTTTVYEDDYISDDYRNGAFSRQSITTKGDDDDLDITIAGATGNYNGMPTRRSYEIRVEDSWAPEKVKIDGDELPFEPDVSKPGWSYQPDSVTVVIRTPEFPIRKKVEIELEFDDDAKNRSVLDEGLRGKLRILRDVEAILGDKTPAAVAKMNQRVASFATRPTDAAKVLKGLPDEWPALVEAVAGCEADAETRNKAVTRIMGLVADLTLAPRKGDVAALDAVLSIATTVNAPAAQRLHGTVTMSVTSPWVFDSEDATPSEGSASQVTTSFDNGGESGVLRQSWLARVPDNDAGDDRVWQTSAIHANVKLALAPSLSGGSRSAMPVSFVVDKIVLPSINAWWIVGPFDGGPQPTSLANSLPPEGQPIDLKATFKGKDGKTISWRKQVRSIQPGEDLTHEYFTDFDDYCGGRVHDTVAYAVTWLEVPEATDAVLALGSDDGVVVWVNGEEVHRVSQGRSYSAKQDHVKIHLNQGVNELRLKINQGVGDWGFGAHVETEDGEPLPGLRVRLSPGE